jgi:hypothetical protein
MSTFTGPNWPTQHRRRSRALLAVALVIAVVGVVATLPVASHAQAGPPTPASAAPSASSVGPRATKPPQRSRSPEEAADRAAALGEYRPERAVAPQLSIPFGKTEPRTKPTVSAPRSAIREPRGGVDDDAARCSSKTDSQARSACLEKRSDAPRKPPG